MRISTAHAPLGKSRARVEAPAKKDGSTWLQPVLIERPHPILSCLLVIAVVAWPVRGTALALRKPSFILASLRVKYVTSKPCAKPFGARSSTSRYSKAFLGNELLQPCGFVRRRPGRC